MNLNRIHDYCTSLAVSAMLTSAFLAAAPEGFMAAGAGPLGASMALESAMTGLRADGWHGAAGMALPATFATAQTKQVTSETTPAPSPFTEIQLKKINQYWDKKGKQMDIKTQYSRLLGLTKGDEVISFRKVSGTDEANIYHLFARLNNGAGYFLTHEQNQGESRLYWVGFDFKVIAAISVSKDNGTAVIPASEAQKELASEYKDWAEFADTL